MQNARDYAREYGKLLKVLGRVTVDNLEHIKDNAREGVQNGLSRIRNLGKPKTEVGNKPIETPIDNNWVSFKPLKGTRYLLNRYTLNPETGEYDVKKVPATYIDNDSSVRCNPDYDCWCLAFELDDGTKVSENTCAQSKYELAPPKQEQVTGGKKSKKYNKKSIARKGVNNKRTIKRNYVKNVKTQVKKH